VSATTRTLVVNSRCLVDEMVAVKLAYPREAKHPILITEPVDSPGPVSNFVQIVLIGLRRISTIETPSAARAFNSTFDRTFIKPHKPHQPSVVRRKSKCAFKMPRSCSSQETRAPVCGADTVLAEIEPHPLHVNFEIHGYLCDRCGPVKSLVARKLGRSQNSASRVTLS